MKRQRIKKWATILAAALLTALGAGKGVRADALNWQDAVRGTRSISVANEGQRAFRLDYKVWSGAWVGEEAPPCQILLLLDVSHTMSRQSGGNTFLDTMKDNVKTFLQELSQVSPNAQVGLAAFGKKADVTEPVTLDAQGLEVLTEAVESLKAESAGEPDCAGALEQAGALAEQLKADRPLYLVTVTSGLWKGEREKALPALSGLLDRGAKSCSVLLCGEPDKEAAAFWQEMCSAPLSSSYYVCDGDASDSLDRIRREAASVHSVEVVQELDPRFLMGREEQERLRREGAVLDRREDGAWTVTWTADLPREKESPWEASLTIKAREEFPGGNNIPVDRDGTGLYLSLKRIAMLESSQVNVPLKLNLQDVETELFLGEKVRLSVNGEKVEETMFPEPEWFQMGPSGRFSTIWETGSGRRIGGAGDLETLSPQKDSVYRLRVIFRPASSGKDAVGAPVPVEEASALYRVKLKTGTVRIRIKAGEGASLRKEDSLQLRMEKNGREAYLCTARPEWDPENGELFLTAEIGDLSCGRYALSPVPGSGITCRETEQICYLGMWDRDDTVSTERDLAWAEFTLGKPE